jgi:PTH2 family peptidyl-tRNA hydrolase
MYAVIREDLAMNHGKAASQAGHAFLDSYTIAPPDIRKAYIEDGGTKIVLQVPDERALVDIFHAAKMAKLPCAMVVEQNHIMPPHFDGSPIITAIGIGPVMRSEARSITKGLKLLA